MAEERQQEGIGSGVSNAEQEIRALEQRLEEKKRALAEQGNTGVPEKEIFRDVVREHMERSATDVASTRQYDTSPRVPHPEQSAAHDNAVQNLVAQALSGNIASAMDKAYRESPYLVDALHDRLVDEYYDKLVALRKIDAW